LTTVEQLRENLCRAALREPERRFHQLFDKLYRPDILRRAFERACCAGGRPPGYGRGCLEDTGEMLRNGVFRPHGAVFGDRVVDEALALVLEPLLLPGRRFDAWEVLGTLRDLLARSRGPVLCLKVMPDWTLCPGELLGLLERRLADRRLLALVRAFLAVGLRPAILDFGRLNVPRLDGGVGPLLGDYQLSVAGLLLSAGLPGLVGVVRGGNEVVLVGGDHTTDHDLAGWRDVLTGLGLTALAVRPFATARDGFDFMGLHWRKRSGSGEVVFQPAQAGVRAIRCCIREMTSGKTHLGLDAVVARINRPLGEWGAYYRICPHRAVMKDIDVYVRERLARFNAKKHGLSGPGLGRPEVSRRALRELGLIELGKLPQGIN